MKQLLLTLMMAYAGSASFAQDNWKVFHNKQEILSSTEFNETKNTVQLNADVLNSRGELLVVYYQKTPVEGWERKIMVVDENDQQLIVKPASSRLSIPNEELKALADKHGKLRIFTISLPSDPGVAATVRVARRHLCTLELK